MLMNPQKLSEMTDAQFDDLVMLIRHSSLNAANLSSNVALTFLSNMPSDSRAEGGSGLEAAEEDERRLMEYDDDDKPVAIEFHEARNDSMSSKKERFSSVAAIRYRLSRLVSYFRERKMTQASDLSETPIDSARRSRRKFYISYADLMVPSSFDYDPKTLDIPLYDFRRKAMSTSDSIEARAGHHDDAREHAHAKVHPIRFESNALFREKHPWLHPTMSFTKMWWVAPNRSRIKFTFLSLPSAVGHLEPSTSAIAWTLFERWARRIRRLTLIGIVTKFNRKLFSTICFILAYKFNQDYEPEAIAQILTHLTRERNMDVKSVFYHEMKVGARHAQIFTLLDFSLKLKYSHIQAHIRHYLEHNVGAADPQNLSFAKLYDTPEETFAALEAD